MKKERPLTERQRQLVREIGELMRQQSAPRPIPVDELCTEPPQPGTGDPPEGDDADGPPEVADADPKASRQP